MLGVLGEVAVEEQARVVMNDIVGGADVVLGEPGLQVGFLREFVAALCGKCHGEIVTEEDGRCVDPGLLAVPAFDIWREENRLAHAGGAVADELDAGFSTDGY